MARDRGSRPGARPHRLFVAIEIPPAAQVAVDEAVAPWREAFPRARWAPPENRHVTLKFLGPTYPRLLERVRTQAGEVAASCAAFDAGLTGLGAFPSRGRARVLWVGLDDDAGRVTALVDALDAALAADFPPESRSFHPHLTVARSDPPLALPEAFAQTPVAPVAWRVERLVLFESHLHRPAARYELLAVFPLRT